MKRSWIFSVLILIVIIFGIRFFINKKRTAGVNIAVISIVEIEPIAELRNGFKNQLSKSEFAKNNKILYSDFNAQGENSIINQIVDDVILKKYDLVYVLGTPISQAIQKRDPNIIIVQGAVTDPIEAGLAASWEGSKKNYAATTDLPPINKQIELIKSLTPNVKRLGIIYNPSEINSVAVIKRLKSNISQNNINIELVERGISNTSEAITAVESMKGKIDAIYLPPDNTAHAAIKVIGKIANDSKIPFYATVKNATQDGALAALSLDFYTLGEESADIAVRILDKKEIAGNIPIKPNENPRIFINEKVANSLNINLSRLQLSNIEIIK